MANEVSNDTLYKNFARLALRVSILASNSNTNQNELAIYNVALGVVNHAQNLIGKDNPRASRLFNNALRLVNSAKSRKAK
jgi:hypothetical protein